ncbi:MAG TPA: serine--tRNA ligase [Sulfurospirillum arcachonense]|nr:serine--tRNA ligase [Sulfurospirillum arcachonense]HIP44557.1 serine--tRNA ligase [Sulfurospirillum arcachonense]
MLDIKLLQNDFDVICEKLRKKKVDEETLSTLKTISLELKTEKKVLEELQAEQNVKSKLFGVYAKEGKDINELKAELSQNKTKVIELNSTVKELEDKLSQIANTIPNIPDDSVPEGKSEDDNVELDLILTPPAFDFTPKEHWDLDNGWLDFERGVKIAKSRFTALRGDGAKLNRALINYMLDFNTKRGFSEVSVPFIANRETLTGTGQLPKFEDDLFKIEGEDLFLIPTAEVPVTNLFRDEIISANELPIKMTCYSECFRKEAGSAGRDTRGMIRQHQFSKVELVSITKPEQSEEVFNEMVDCASDLLTSLGLAHRKVMLCGGDLGFSAAKTIDLEVWFPGQDRYREISSISNTMDFQSRRAKIRYKDGKKNRLTHTLNGSSLAVGRTLIAIMENYQNEDGTIRIPEVLKSYM